MRPVAWPMLVTSENLDSIPILHQMIMGLLPGGARDEVIAYRIHLDQVFEVRLSIVALERPVLL